MVQFNAYGFNHDIYSSFTLLHSTFGQCNALSKRRKTHILCHDGIIAIICIYASLQSASALSLYWAISATFLIIQMHFAHSHYAKVGKAAGEQLKRQIEQQRQNKTNDDKA